MIKIFLFAMGFFLFLLNTTVMFKRPTKNDPTIRGYKTLIENDRGNERWREIGRTYQFLSVPIQSLILSLTMLLSYFSLLSTFGAYISIAILIGCLLILLLSQSRIKEKLSLHEHGVERVNKMLKLGIRASISFSIIIYVICIGI